MADSISSPSFTGTRRVMDAFAQGSATGRIPSKRYLDQLIQSELDAASNNAIKNKAFNEQVRQFNTNQAQQSKQFDIAQQNAMDTSAANRDASTTGAITNLATTAGGMYLMNKWRTPTGNAGGGATGINPGPTVNTSWNPIRNTGNPINTTISESFPMSATSGLPATTSSSAMTSGGIDPFASYISTPATELSISGPSAISSSVAPPASATGVSGSSTISGAGAGAGSAAGATAGSIASTAAPYVALATEGMPMFGHAMGQGFRDAFGIDPEGSNTIAQLNRAAGRGVEGAVIPVMEEVFGMELSDLEKGLINPGGWLLGELGGGFIHGLF